MSQKEDEEFIAVCELVEAAFSVTPPRGDELKAVAALASSLKRVIQRLLAREKELRLENEQLQGRLQKLESAQRARQNPRGTAPARR